MAQQHLKTAFPGSTVYAEQFNEATLVDNLLVLFSDVVSTTGGSPVVRSSPSATPPEDCHLQQQNHHGCGVGGSTAQSQHLQRAANQQQYEQVRWAKFDQLSATDLAAASDQPQYDETATPLLLLLGLDQGVQAWLLRPGGEAQLVMRLGRYPARLAALLPTPHPADPAADRFRSQRPLLAVCWAHPGAENAAAFLSLRSAEPAVREPAAEAPDPLEQIAASRSRVVLAHGGLEPRVLILSSLTLTKLAMLSGLFPSPPLPLALADRWLAYADRSLRPHRRSTCQQQSEVLEPPSSVLRSVTAFFSGAAKGANQPVGVVTVLDLGRLAEGALVRDPHESSVTAAAMVAHFAAHPCPLAYLTWDPAGSLLLSADTSGRYFHVFRLQAHPLSCTGTTVQLLYRLYRGETPACVQDAVFSRDSRWAAISTNHGTTHVFPLCPYGGSANWRTHGGPQVVNRASCYQKTSGFEPQSQSKPVDQAALAQVKLRPASTARAAGSSASAAATSAASSVGISVGGSGSALTNGICKAAVFAPARANPLSSATSSIAASASVCAIDGSGNSSGGGSIGKLPTDSLFVFTGPACCSEHTLDVLPKQPLPNGCQPDRVPPDQAIELDCRPVALWRLTGTSGGVQGCHPAMLRAGCGDSGESLPPLADARSRESLASDSSSRGSAVDESAWPSQVEITCHLGPARRLWMGPQFTFRTYQDPEAAVATAASAPAASAASSASLTATASAPAPVRRRASSSGSSAASSGRMLIEGGSYTEPGPLIQRALLHSSNPSSSLGSDSLLLLNDAIQDCRSPSPVGGVGGSSGSSASAAAAAVSASAVVGFRDEDFQESWE